MEQLGWVSLPADRMCAARQITPTPPTYHRTVDEPRGIATLLEDPAAAHLGLRLLGRGILLRVCEGEQGGGKEEGKRLYHGGSFEYRLAKINYCETNLSNWDLVL